jgi:hypothetical protein
MNLNDRDIRHGVPSILSRVKLSQWLVS